MLDNRFVGRNWLGKRQAGGLFRQVVNWDWCGERGVGVRCCSVGPEQRPCLWCWYHVPGTVALHRGGQSSRLQWFP